MKKGLRLILLSALLFTGTLFSLAENFVIIGKEGKVFDEPNAKYVTLNQKNKDVTVIPGMVFKTTEKSPGWYMIEYSPGLRAYISDQLISGSNKVPQPGTYSIKNNSTQQLSATLSDNEWKATVNNKSYAGKINNNAVIFYNEDNTPAFSLVDLGQGAIAITYDNNITDFF